MPFELFSQCDLLGGIRQPVSLTQSEITSGLSRSKKLRQYTHELLTFFSICRGMLRSHIFIFSLTSRSVPSRHSVRTCMWTALNDGCPDISSHINWGLYISVLSIQSLLVSELISSSCFPDAFYPTVHADLQARRTPPL